MAGENNSNSKMVICVTAFIGFLGMFFSHVIPWGVAVYFAMIPIGIVLELARDKQPRTAARVLEVILIYFIVFLYGIAGINAFMGHAFMPDAVAKFIGWPAGNPFQTEIAFCNLGYGVLGILCIWLRGNFLAAPVVGNSIFFLGAAYVHINDIKLHQNYAPGNAGISVLYLGDITFPILIICLFIACKVIAGREKR